ncbi:MAG TPA: hypothetical protein VMI56_04730 [Reyranella sp.]|nr:hypothetical protein [Reyranella sp.]
MTEKAAPQKDDREQRLAAALRENLKRRKAQARSQAPGKDGPDKQEKAR